jgi:peptidoglycan hydrolase CwlO-like protein
MSRKEKVIENLKLTNELLRTEVSSLNDQIRSLDDTIASRDAQIGELQKQLAVAESRISPVVVETPVKEESGGILSYFLRFKYSG